MRTPGSDRNGTSAASKTTATAIQARGLQPERASENARRSSVPVRLSAAAVTRVPPAPRARARAAISSSTNAIGRTSRYDGPSCHEPRWMFAIPASTTPSTSPAANARSGGPKRTASAATSPFSPSSVPVFALTASPGGRDRRDHRERTDEAERKRDEQVDRHADHPGALRVVGDRPQGAPEARPLEQPRRAQREREREPDHEERPRFDVCPGHADEPGRADAMEWQRIREDVARPLESGADHGADGERDRRGPGHPADRRSAREVRLDDPDVGRHPGGRCRARGRRSARRGSEARARPTASPARFPPGRAASRRSRARRGRRTRS